MGGDRPEPIKDGIVDQVVIWLQRNASAALKCEAFPFAAIGKTRGEAEADHETMCWILSERHKFWTNLQVEHPDYPGMSKARVEFVRDRWWKGVAQPRVWRARPSDPMGDLNAYDGIRQMVRDAGCVYKYDECR